MPWRASKADLDLPTETTLFCLSEKAAPSDSGLAVPHTWPELFAGITEPVLHHLPYFQ